MKPRARDPRSYEEIRALSKSARRSVRTRAVLHDALLETFPAYQYAVDEANELATKHNASTWSVRFFPQRLGTPRHPFVVRSSGGFVSDRDRGSIVTYHTPIELWRYYDTPEADELVRSDRLSADSMKKLKKAARLRKAARQRDPQSSSTVFHGTRRVREIQEHGFVPSRGGEFGPGIYFTDFPPTAAFYALRVATGPDTPTVLATKIQLERPYVVRKIDWIKMTQTRSPSVVIRALKRKGYDGIVGVALNDVDRQIVVWNPDQIDNAATRIHEVL